MQFFMQTTGDANAPLPDQEVFAEMAKFIEEGFRDGTLIATGSLDPRKTRITSSGGKITVTDGPYTEAKEAVVGWALVKVDSKEEAIELSKRFWEIAGDGSGIIQRVYEPGEQPAVEAPRAEAPVGAT